MDLQTKRTYIPWIDFLRIFACFLVVLCHSCDAFVASFDNSFSFHTAVFIGSLVRPCVPLFAMMSGILLFPIKTDLATFYKKRIGRIIIPLLFWSIALPIAFALYAYFIQKSPNGLISIEKYTVEGTMTKIITSIFNFNYDTTPLWYIYMLIGIYLIIPIFGSWLDRASKKDIQIFLGFWIVTLVLAYIKMAAPLLGYNGNYGNTGIWGVCTWNEFGTFYYFSGFIGYIVLAYYLVKFPLNWSWNKTLSIAVPLFLIGFVITFSGFLITQKYFPANYANLEIVWYFCSINVAMMTFSVFIIFQRLKVRESKALKDWSLATFGIFLSHFIIVQGISDLFFKIPYLPAGLKIILIAVISFVLSYLVTKLFDTNSITRRFVK